MSNPVSNLTSTYTNRIEQSIDYGTDAAQRSELYLDTMHKRGNINIEYALLGKTAPRKNWGLPRPAARNPGRVAQPNQQGTAP